MVVFVSNNAYLDAKADDGVRKALYNEFDYIYVVNLKGNARLDGEAWRREGGKIFGQQARVGVVVSFFIKTGEGISKIEYAQVDDYMNRNDKLKWLAKNTITMLEFEQIKPDSDAVWLNQTDNNFDDLVSVLPKTQKESIFAESTLGISTNKDQWAYDYDKENLKEKIKFYISAYNDNISRYKIERPDRSELTSWVDKRIKWTRTLIQNLSRMHNIMYLAENTRKVLYRPFLTKIVYYDRIIIHDIRKFPVIFTNSQKKPFDWIFKPINQRTFQLYWNRYDY